MDLGDLGINSKNSVSQIRSVIFHYNSFYWVLSELDGRGGSIILIRWDLKRPLKGWRNCTSQRRRMMRKYFPGSLDPENTYASFSVAVYRSSTRGYVLKRQIYAISRHFWARASYPLYYTLIESLGQGATSERGVSVRVARAFLLETAKVSKIAFFAFFCLRRALKIVNTH